jgi:hypothetical protein
MCDSAFLAPSTGRGAGFRLIRYVLSRTIRLEAGFLVRKLDGGYHLCV